MSYVILPLHFLSGVFLGIILRVLDQIYIKVLKAVSTDLEFKPLYCRLMTVQSLDGKWG